LKFNGPMILYYISFMPLRPFGIFCGYEVRRNWGRSSNFVVPMPMRSAARLDLRNRCLEPPGSDSSRIPISLYFITSHPRAHSRHRRYSVPLPFLQRVLEVTKSVQIPRQAFLLSNFHLSLQVYIFQR